MGPCLSLKPSKVSILLSLKCYPFETIFPSKELILFFISNNPLRFYSVNSNLPIPFSDAAKIGTILLAAKNRHAKSFVSGLILDLYQSLARLNRIVDGFHSVRFMAKQITFHG